MVLRTETSTSEEVTSPEQRGVETCLPRRRRSCFAASARQTAGSGWSRSAQLLVLRRRRPERLVNIRTPRQPATIDLPKLGLLRRRTDLRRSETLGAAPCHGGPASRTIPRCPRAFARTRRDNRNIRPCTRALPARHSAPPRSPTAGCDHRQAGPRAPTDRAPRQPPPQPLLLHRPTTATGQATGALAATRRPEVDSTSDHSMGQRPSL